VTEIRRVSEPRDLLGETPLWCEKTKCLWWVDIDRAQLQRFCPENGRHDLFSFDAKHAGSLALRSSGGLLIGLDLGLFTFDPRSGKLLPFCQVEPAHLNNRLNDGRCDGAGRFWVGTMDNDLSEPTGSLYRIEPDGSVIRALKDVIVSNAIAISPDQKTFYFSDTRRFTIRAFDLDLAAGTLANERIFVDHTKAQDRPDGACVDAEGFIWNAIFAGRRVVRYAPDGRIHRVIDLPVTNPTCVCFGGPGLRTLYITTARKFLSREQLRSEPWAGAVLAVDAGVTGLPEKRFAG
jgi:sugar lactone lactonase YvrE